MDMNNAADIILPNVDTEPINLALEDRWRSLGCVLNAEAQEQFEKDTENIVCFVKSDGSVLSFSAKEVNSSYLDYLKNPYTPLAGGIDGIVHELDGSTHVSNVPEQLQGTELPWFEVGAIDVAEEAQKIIELMAPDAAQNAVASSKQQIAEQIVKPYVQQELAKVFGGD